MELTPKPPSPADPDPSAGQALSIARVQRLFGEKAASQYASHLKRLQTGRPWFVSIDLSGAKFFTHFKKLEVPVKNARSITGSQKFIAKNADNWGMVF